MIYTDTLCFKYQSTNIDKTTIKSATISKISPPLQLFPACLATIPSIISDMLINSIIIRDWTYFSRSSPIIKKGIKTILEKVIKLAKKPLFVFFITLLPSLP